MTLPPPALQPGQAIGVVSPSFGAAGLFPHRTEQALRFITFLGYQVKFAQHALNHQNWASDSPQNRAADLHELFLDPQVGAIVAGIGGDHSCQLLPYLDFDLIKAHPKIFMGYSDITVLNLAIWQQTGLGTINGPALITDFAEQPAMFAYTQNYLFKLITQPKALGLIEPSPAWTEEFMDWSEKKDLERPRRLQTSPGWTWLKAGRAEGPLIGGCLESLDHLRGTRFWPNWQGALFFFETSEEKPSPARVDSLLSDYENMGILAQINGLLVGRPMLYSDVEKQELNQVILERCAHYTFPILTGMDFGHTAPQFPMPIGCLARMDSTAQRFEILEAAVTGAANAQKS
jgi:muramoyltetrapeptide carboxypeptidase LdcA involved in peptidoglycan recycling